MKIFKTFIGSVIFTIAVLAFINFAGDVLVGHEARKDMSASKVTPVAPVVEVAPVTKIAEAGPEPVPKIAKEAPAVVATPEPVVVAPVVVATSGNAGMGAKTFRKKCAGCHPVSDDGANRTGPNLFDVIGRDKAAVEGYRYSSGLKKLGGTWTEKEINTFIAGPRVMVPKTKMTFSGVKKEDQRNNIVAYLRSLSK